MQEGSKAMARRMKLILDPILLDWVFFTTVLAAGTVFGTAIGLWIAKCSK